jgi:hypothetical protein
MKVQIGCIIFGSLQWIGMFDIIIGDVINSLESFMKLKESEHIQEHLLRFVPDPHRRIIQYR